MSDTDLAVQFARLEEVVMRACGDIAETRRAATDGLRLLEERVRVLEEIRVRALEDWKVKVQVLDGERQGRLEPLERDVEKLKQADRDRDVQAKQRREDAETLEAEISRRARFRARAWKTLYSVLILAATIAGYEIPHH